MNCMNKQISDLKVAIVGGGIAGFMSALSLIKTAGITGEQISLFEPRDSLDTDKGAGLNLNNGSAILAREYGIDLRTKYKDLCMPMNKAVSKFENGQAVFDMNFSQLFQKNEKLKYVLDDKQQSYIVTLMRSDLQYILYKSIEQENIHFYNGNNYRILNILNNQDQYYLELFDHSLFGPFDLIIGADGIHSVIRNYILKNFKQQKTLKPKYSNIKVAYSIIERDNSKTMAAFNQMNQYMCDGAIVVHYGLNSRIEMVAFLYRDYVSSEENINYKKTIDQQEIKTRTIEKMILSKAPSKCIHAFAKGFRFIETPIYEHPDTPHWSKGNVVIVGDAAHAMTPFLGQGANQTIQDAHLIGLCLKQLGNGYNSIEQIFQKYESVFKSEVEKIGKKSHIMGNLMTQGGTLGTFLRKAILTAASASGMLEKSFMDSFQPRFLGC